MDNKEGALSRLVGELTDNNGKLRKDLQDKIDALVKQFSFDDEQSALSRMSRTVATTNEAISKHLTLDDKDSALSRLRRELMEVLGSTARPTRSSKKKSASRWRRCRPPRGGCRIDPARRRLRGGGVRGRAVGSAAAEGHRHGGRQLDRADQELQEGRCCRGTGPGERRPRGEDRGRSEGGCFLRPDKALAEMETARQNRDAESGLFVFSKKTAPAGLEPLARYGNDVVSCGMPTTRRPTPTCGSGSAWRGHSAPARPWSGAAWTWTSPPSIRRYWRSPSRSRSSTRSAPGRTRSAQRARRFLERLRISREKLEKQGEVLTERVADLKVAMKKG